MKEINSDIKNTYLGGKIMKNNKKDVNIVTGAAFDDMTLAEMAEVQGAGDVEGEVTTPVCAVAVSASLSIQVVKTFKGKC